MPENMGICLLVIARGQELNIQHFFDWKTLSYTYNIVEFPSVNDKLCGDKNLNNSVFFYQFLNMPANLLVRLSSFALYAGWHCHVSFLLMILNLLVCMY